MFDLITTVLSNLNLQTVLVGLVSVIIVQKVRERLRYKLPPGPFALPLIGNYEVFWAQFIHEKFAEYRKRYGPVFQVFMGPVRVVVLNDIKVVTEALIKRKSDFANRKQSASIMMITQGGKDIIFANYTPTWKLHRKIAGNALRKYMAGNNLEIVLHKTMTKCLNFMAAETGPFDPEKYLDLMFFNLMDGVVFGESAELDDPDFLHLMQIFKEADYLFGRRFIEDMFPLLLKIRPSASYTRMDQCMQEMRGILSKKLQHHRESFEPDHLRDLTDALIVARREAEIDENKDLLSKLTDTHLVQTLFEIFFAAINTSRLTIYFALRYMGGLPDIQSQVQKELDLAVGKDRLPGLKDRENLQYGDATLHEIMRLGTVPSIGVPHSTLCDTSVGGYDIPKDTMVIISHWALHHDPNYWKNVDVFDPTRFLDENGKMTAKPESWLPFSMGRRVCLGETVAKPELHLIFSSILQRFNICLDDDTDPEIKYSGASSILQPEHFKIVLKERNR